MDYQKQAEDFLKSVNGKIDVEFFGHGLYFPDDKEQRDIYTFTLSRNGKTYSAKFGQSIANSRKAIPEDFKKYKMEEIRGRFPQGRLAPTAYDVLSCLTNNDPGTFKNFCSEYGYDEDSRKAEKMYFSVQEEYAGVMKVFGDVIEQLAEIQ